MMRRKMLTLSTLSRQDKIALGVLALIALLGLLLRVGGIGWSLPDSRHPLATYHPDELINLGAALSADIPHFQFDIGFYNYGAFYFYLVHFAHILGRGWGIIPSTPPSASSLDPAAATEQAALFLAGRWVTVLLGVGTILALYFLGRRLFGRKAGLIGAALYAITPLAVIHSHFLTVDVPATFFIVMALLWAVRLLERQDWANYVWAGIWVGLATATKYTACLVLIAPLLAHRYNQPEGACQLHRKAHLSVLLVAVTFAFIIGCPGPLINWQAFWEGTYPGSGLRYELLEHSRNGHGDLFLDTGFGGWYHLVVSLRYGMGTPLLLLALFGLGYAVRRRTTGDKILLTFLLLSYLSVSFSAVRFARYMIPLLPILCLFGARWLCECCPDKQKITFVFGGVVALITLLSSGTYVRGMMAEDPRDSAERYLQAKSGSIIAFAKIPWFFSPPLSPLFGAPSAPQRMKAVEQTTQYQLKISTSEWDRTLLQTAPQLVIVSNIETMHAVTRLKQPEPTRFMEALNQSYNPTVFAPPYMASTANAPLIPEDILYIIPTITVYERK